MADEQPVKTGDSAFDDTAAAFKEVMGGATRIDEPVSQEPTDETPEKPEKAERSRDEQGRFAKEEDKPEKAEKIEKTVDKPVAKDSVQPLPVVESPPVVPAIDAPQSWTAEAKAHWAKLPPEAQKYIAARESEAHKQITSQGERVKSYEGYEKVVNQYRQDFERRGLKPEAAFASLLEAQRMLDNNPVHGLTQIARSYGIDLSQVFAGQAQQAQQVDPNLFALQQQMERQQREIAEWKQQLETQQQADSAAEIERFAKDKPHFEEVRKLMGSLMQSGHADTLDTAYDMAVNATPSIRERIQAEKAQAQEAERKQKEKEAAEKAKAASRSITGSPSSSVGKTDTTKGSSAFDDARAAYREVMGRV